MLEVIAWAPDLATLSKAANATGFVDKQVDPVTKAVIKQSIKTNGTWAGSKGGWALNLVPQFLQPTGKMVDQTFGKETVQVPEMAPVPGVWARLRWNDMAMMDRMNQFIAAVKAQGVFVYQKVNLGTEEKPEWIWSHDGGKSKGPAYLDNIGLML
jgi:hypothetical protein